jgi:predicted AAA+ superfamily ATPase
MYKNRTLKDTILSAEKFFKIVLLTGMRQVGKTTFLRHISSKDRKYVTLDDPKTLLMAKNEPEIFFQKYAPPILIDEVQYAPELFPYIKMLVDSSDKTGQIFMTGSQQYSMMKNVTESLAGRAAITDISGFSIYEREGKGLLQQPFLPDAKLPEVLDKKNTAKTYEIIWQGSYPQIANASRQNWELFYGSYLKSYLERDVRQLKNILNESRFIKFMSVVAARTAQELDASDIARNTDIDIKTTNDWLSVLEASGIIFLLKPYYKNITKRFIKRPKLYFTDTGLCSYLTQWSSPEVLEAGAMSGAIFETFVINEIIKSYKHNGKNQQFYYYRDSQKKEIDLLISQNGLFYPIEIKKTGHPKKEDISAFKTLETIENVGYGSLICLTEQSIPLTQKANAVSVWDI